MLCNLRRPRALRPAFFFAAAAIAFAVVNGCGADHEPTYPVNGAIVWEDGQPASDLAGGTVSLQRAEESKVKLPTSVSPMGEILPDGTFKLRSFEPGDGAPAGEYQVMIVPKLLGGADDPLPKIIDEKYTDYPTSPLTMTVEAKENQVTLRLPRLRK